MPASVRPPSPSLGGFWRKPAAAGADPLSFLNVSSRTPQTERAQLWLIWGLVAALAALQLLVWTAGGRVDSRTISVWLVAGWIVTVVLAVLASRRIGTLSDQLTQREDAHRATL